MEKKEPAGLVRWTRKWGEGRKASFEELPEDDRVRLVFEMPFEVEAQTSTGITVHGSATLSVMVSVASTAALGYLVVDTLWRATSLNELPEIYYGGVDLGYEEEGGDEDEDVFYGQLLEMANQCNEELPSKTVVVEREEGYYLQVRDLLPLGLCTRKSTEAVLDQHESSVSFVITLYQQMLHDSFRG